MGIIKRLQSRARLLYNYKYMEKQNCWEFKKCGREIGGINAAKDGVCPAATFETADGFCGGKNGGRACAYIMGTLCSADVCKIDDIMEKQRICAECDFYKLLKQEHDGSMSLITFHDYIEQKKNKK